MARRAGPVLSPPVRELVRLAREFGPEAARARRKSLEAILAAPGWRRAEVRPLHDAIAFALAHPDDAVVRDRAAAAAVLLRRRVAAAGREADVGSGLPGSACVHAYSHAVAERLVALAPGAVEIDWDELEDKGRLHEALALLVGSMESPSLDDVDVSTRDWLERLRGRRPSALALVLALFRAGGLDAAQRATLYEACEVPLRLSLDGPGRAGCDVRVPVERVHFQRTALRRESFPVIPLVRRPLPRVRRLSRAAGQRLIDAALWALASRALEIYPLSHASADDVVVASCGRGVEVATCGVDPDHRLGLEGLSLLLVLKNGALLGYGPAMPLFGCVEMGLNLFDEHRGGETRFLYAQVMRVLHHVLGVRCFFATPYAMGRQNDEALRSGAFWFYRKLGFQPTNPRVEALARAEEERLAREPGARSSAATLRRLSDTEAVLDLSGGRCRRFDSTALGFAVSRRVEEAHGGDRRRAERHAVARARRALRLADWSRWSAAERAALARLAPALDLVPDLEEWSARDARRLAALVRSKAARSETAAVRGIASHGRLEAALRAAIQRA